MTASTAIRRSSSRSDDGQTIFRPRQLGMTSPGPAFGSGWPDSNRRPPAPKAGALTKLRHIPCCGAGYPAERSLPPGRVTGAAGAVPARHGSSVRETDPIRCRCLPGTPARRHRVRGRSSMAEPQPSKLVMRVRFPSPAPTIPPQVSSAGSDHDPARRSVVAAVRATYVPEPCRTAGFPSPASGLAGEVQIIAYKKQLNYNEVVSAQTLGFAVQPEDRPVLNELVAYFGDGNRSAYLRATLRIMRSVMLADQLRETQAYGQQRTAELGIDPSEVPARVREFLKRDAGPTDQ